ncbi:response regulator transcription factor [Butyrivibrio sp. LB2008]|uniref:response regulator transcription factor n=1 Tax=Butyrivibrio sp. LB2008 TaxID=1408305 RepID=UPI00047AC1C9|nr:helix-turn-helix domain-containing protein [Butyrivibrio sp. LB2008]
MEAIVIDDDIPTVDVIVDTVAWDKFHIDKVHTAYNIETAKKLFSENDISLAICDIEMPMGTGLELIKWVRENGIETEFIFLTSHEKFDYARQAIEYSASGYVVKPFNNDRMEAELTNAIQKLHDKKESHKASLYEEWYSGNLGYVEALFWLDVLQQRIASDKAVIAKEISQRRLNIDADRQYQLYIIAGGNIEQIEENWGKGGAGTYEKELVKFLGNSIFIGISEGKFVNYRVKNIIYTAIVVGEDDAGIIADRLNSEGLQVLEKAKEVLRNIITVYIGNACDIDKLCLAKTHIEELDKNNVASKGKVFHENDEIVLATEKGHMLDQQEIRLLLNEKKKKELLNLLKFSMENLAAAKKLDAAALAEIKQDLLQIVFVYLHGKEIQATQLFANEASESLERQATDSLMNMVRWQVYLISETLDYVSEVEASDSIVSRAKAFVHEHYKEDISRTEIAECVYLTPEYMAKMFKKETGISLKQYITDFRIDKAKELLSRADARISDVATEVGFDNFSYFSTVFKKTTGLTPNEYHTQNLKLKN